MKKEITYYENGNVRSIIERNDERQWHGECKLFHENGKLKEHSHWNNNQRHGERKWFYEDGQLEAHSFWKNGKLHGECKLFHENGRLRAIIQFDNEIGFGKLFEENGDIWLCKWNEWWIEKRIMLLKGEK